jgi:diacylglycerol kinase (ATP)
MNNNKWSVIVNPNAGNRGGEKDLPQIKSLLTKAGIDYSIYLTREKSHATELASDLITDGNRNLICVGGDGTLNEIVNGIFSQTQINTSEIVLALIPVGLGNDWCRTHHIPFDYEKAVDLIRLSNKMLHDVGKVSFMEGNETISRFFINVAGMGFDAEVAASVNQLKLTKPEASQWLYLKQLFLCLLKSKAKNIKVTFDNDQIETSIFSLSTGICIYNGGGMQQLPLANPADGLFDLTIIRKVGILKVLMNVHKLFNGKINTISEVSMHTARNIRVECDEDLMLECDGENVGRQPFTFEILQNAVQVITGLI